MLKHRFKSVEARWTANTERQSMDTPALQAYVDEQYWREQGELAIRQEMERRLQGRLISKGLKKANRKPNR